MPLNLTLYNALRHRFGEVIVANEGEAMTTRTVYYEPGRRRLEPIHPGEYYRIACPVCQDSRKRLWVNHRFGTVDPYTGHPMLFLAICYRRNCLSKPGAARKLYDMIFGFVNRDQRQRMVISPGRVDDSPPGPKPPPGELAFISQLPPDHPAVQYLVGQRHFGLDLLDHYRVNLCTKADPQYRMAEGRIAVPFFQHGELMGWQARFIGTPLHEDIPKYYTCPGVKKKLMLYNLDNARDKPFVVVVEGVTDVWRVGDHAVALLGKEPSRAQQALLATHWPDKPIIILLDADAQDGVQGIVRDMTRIGTGPVIQVTLPDGEDPAGLDRAQVWNIIRRQADAAGVCLS